MDCFDVDLFVGSNIGSNYGVDGDGDKVVLVMMTVVITEL